MEALAAADGNRYSPYGVSLMNDRKPNDRTRGPLIETDRLDLCYPETRADQLALERIYGDSDTMRYLGPPFSSDKVAARILTWQQLWRDFGLGPVMALEKDSSLIVGTGGIFPEARIPGESGMEIGFMMLPDFRKRGFATELASALTKYIFEEAGAERIVADSHPDNAASNRVLQKLGYNCLGEIRAKYEEFPGVNRQLLWEMTKQDWLILQKEPSR